MDDQQIIDQIGELAAEERRLEEAHVGDGLSDAERSRLSQVERTLDQLWDLLRQRRALRQVGRDPDQAATRPEGTVEHYQQ
jgi:hypothetical protein